MVLARRGPLYLLVAGLVVSAAMGVLAQTGAGGSSSPPTATGAPGVVPPVPPGAVGAPTSGAATSALVGPGPSSATVPFLQIARVAQAPNVDGVLRDKVWDTCSVLNQFAVVSELRRAKQDTEVRLLCDDQYLYIGFRCRDNDLAGAPAPAAKAKDDPAVLTDDHVELLLDAKRDRRTYLEIAVSRNGQVYDAMAQLGAEAADIAGLKAVTGNLAWAWEAEIAIPLSAVGLSSAAGTTFNLNLARLRAADGERSSWCPARGSFHDPANFAEAALAEGPVAVQLLDMGDGCGELRGGSALRMRLERAAPASVAATASIYNAGTKVTYPVAAPDTPATPVGRQSAPISLEAGRAKKVEIPYSIKEPEFALAQVQVTDATGVQVLFRSPRVPLVDTWLVPRVNEIKSTLSDIKAYATSLAEGDPAKAPLQTRAGEIDHGVTPVQGMIESKDTWGNPARWAKIRDQIIALQKSTAELTVAASLARGRTPEEVTAKAAIPKYYLSGGDWMSRVVPDTVPRFEDVKPRAYCFASPGEVEPVTVVVHTTTDLMACTASLTEFIDTATKSVAPPKFAASQASIRVVHCWEQAGTGAALNAKQKVVVPELLLVDDTERPAGLDPLLRLDGPVKFDVPAGKSKQLWISVAVPKGTPPGLYESTLTVTPQGAPPRSIKIWVKVLKIDLVEPQQKWMVYFRNSLGGDPTTTVSRALYASYLADIASHGFEQATVSEPGSTLLEALEMRKSAGLLAPATISLSGVDPEELGGFVAAARRLASGKELPEMWFYTVAEPRTSQDLQRAVAAAKAIQASGSKTITTIDPTMAGLHGSSLDMAIYNILEPEFENYVLGALQSPATREPRPQFYQWAAGVEDPKINRLLAGLYLAKTRMDGVFLASYQDLAGATDPYNEMQSTAPTRPQMLTYPSKNGPVSTVQWEAAREGHDDMRYVATLERAVADAQPYAARADVDAALGEARKLLSSIPHGVQVDWRYNLVALSDDYYGKTRWELAVKTLRLREAVAAAQAGVPAPSSPGVTGTAPGATPTGGATTPPTGTGSAVAPPGSSRPPMRTPQ